jgi:hypothetical protein
MATRLRLRWAAQRSVIVRRVASGDVAALNFSEYEVVQVQVTGNQLPTMRAISM